MFELHDFELLHRFKVKNAFDDLPITANYFCCFSDKLIFIKKARKYYQIAASSQCGFEPAFRMQIFDILYESKDFNEVVRMFQSYVIRLVLKCPV